MTHRIEKNQLKLDRMQPSSNYKQDRASSSELNKARKLDQRNDGLDGGLLCQGILMTPGILEYVMPDGSIRREYRSAEEIKKAIERGTFVGRPTTNDHPPDMLTSKDATKYATGSVTKAQWFEPDRSGRIDFLLIDGNAIADFEDGKRALSGGVWSDDLHKPGVFEGQEYDIEQTNLRLNHVAQVDLGRDNNAHARMDSAQTTEKERMSKRIIKTKHNGSIEVSADQYEILKAKFDEYDEAMDEMQEAMDEMNEAKGDEDKPTMDTDMSEEMMGMMKAMVATMSELKEMMSSMMGSKEDEDPTMDEEDPTMDEEAANKMDRAQQDRLGLLLELKEVQGANFKQDEAVKLDSDSMRREIIKVRIPSMADGLDKVKGAELRGMYIMAKATKFDAASQLNRSLLNPSNHNTPTGPTTSASSALRDQMVNNMTGQEASE